MRATVPIYLRWGDQDAYGHINNVQILRILEEARVRTLWQIADCPGIITNINANDDSDLHSVLAHHNISYYRPIHFQCSPLQVVIWIGRIGGASLDIECEIWTDQTRDGKPCVRAKTTIVFVEAATGLPRKIEADHRRQLERYLEPRD